MSIARAFTKRMKRGDDSSSSRSAKNNVSRLAPVVISSPVEFLSTTNVHALSAPNIQKISEDLSSSSSTHSFNDSDFSSMIDRSFQSINGNYDSPISSPATPLTPPQDTKGFFHAISGEPTESMPEVPEVPQLPQRCPSHSKKAHVELSRKRSVQRLSPPPVSLSRAGSIRESATMLSSVIQEETMTESSVHPFGAELAKVNEIAEDFGVSTNLLDEEERFMATHGLHKFSVMDYIAEITGMYGGVYEDNLGMAANPWI